MIIINFTFFYEYIKVRDPVHHRETLASLCPLIGQRHQETAIGLPRHTTDICKIYCIEQGHLMQYRWVQAP